MTAPVIVGGGPAGATAAILLARAGISATVLEKAADAQDAICGGFLSWATLENLARMGITDAVLGGHRVTDLAIFAKGREHRFSLPHPAMGLSRRRLDSLLLNHAERCGAQVRRGVAVRAAEGNLLLLANGETLSWTSLFLATGKHELRGLARPRGAAGVDPAMGLRLRLPAAAVPAGRIELHLFDGGYVGMVRQEDGSVNACMAIAKSRLARVGGEPLALLAALAAASPALADRLSALPADSRIDAIGHVPYGWRARATAPGLFRLGDQAAVIPSLAGEGIGIAIASAQVAVDRWLQDGPQGASRYQHGLARATRRPMVTAGIIGALAGRPGIAGIPIATLAAFPPALALIARLTRMPGLIAA